MNISTIVVAPRDVNTENSKTTYFSLRDKESNNYLIEDFALIEFLNILNTNKGPFNIKILKGSKAGKSRKVKTIDSAQGAVLEYAVSEFIGPNLKQHYQLNNNKPEAQYENNEN